MIEEKSNKVSSLLRLKTDEILITKTDKKSNLTNIDILAIHDWINNKEGIEVFNILRAFAFLCSIVEGLDTLFFTIAKELPSKLELNDLTAEAIMENFEGVNKELVSPFDYIKTLQKIFSESDKLKSFSEKFDGNFLEDKLKEINLKFKIIPIEEYDKLIQNIDTKFALNSRKKNCNDGFDYIEFANSIKLSRIILRSDYEKVNIFQEKSIIIKND